MIKQRAARMAVVVAATLAFASIGRADNKSADPSGTWKWSFTNQQGQTFETTLKLKREGDKLTGTVTGRENKEIAIENGQYKDGEVSFQVTRERDGQKFMIKYQGKVTDDTMKGKSEFQTSNGETRSRDWEAKRAK